MLKDLFVSIGDVWEQYIRFPFSDFSVWDALDILILTGVLYGIFLFFKERRAVKLAVGLVTILVVYVISGFAGMRAIHQIMAGVAPFLIILLAIIFQPELRDGLEKLGDRPFNLFTHNKDKVHMTNTINEVIDAACKIALSPKDGALIVIERSTPLGDYVNKGTPIESRVCSDLLALMFTDGTAYHDGAVIIRDNRIAAAKCELPVTPNQASVWGRGSRHMAAVGITEVSDCVVVVVSQQRHTISIANNGFLKRDYNRSMDELKNEFDLKAVKKTLRKDLERMLMGDYKKPNVEEEDDEAGERVSLRTSIKFKWRLSESEEDGDKKGKSLPSISGERKARKGHADRGGSKEKPENQDPKDPQ